MKYRDKDYPIYEKLPEGWIILKGATTAPCGYKWIRNTKSIFDKNKKYGFIKEW